MLLATGKIILWSLQARLMFVCLYVWFIATSSNNIIDDLLSLGLVAVVPSHIKVLWYLYTLTLHAYPIKSQLSEAQEAEDSLAVLYNMVNNSIIRSLDLVWHPRFPCFNN